MQRFTLDGSVDENLAIEQALVHLEAGEIILVPTETQYGLCCDARDIKAMKKLNRIKGRDASTPSAVFVRDWEQASRLTVNTPLRIQQFLRHFWPGPLTVVAQCRQKNWYGVVSEGGNIGFRCSSHPFVKSILREDTFLTATSANAHGDAPLIDPESIIKWLKRDIELFIFDPMVKADAVPSTVISIAEGRLKVLREGAIESTEIKRMWKEAIGGSLE